MALTNDDLQAISNLFQPIKDDVQTIKDNVHVLQKDTQELKSDSRRLKSRTSGGELTLENEANRKIKTIPEGYLDLNRKLDDALKAETEKEILLLRVNHLENELRKVKELLNQIT